MKQYGTGVTLLIGSDCVLVNRWPRVVKEPVVFVVPRKEVVLVRLLTHAIQHAAMCGNMEETRYAGVTIDDTSYHRHQVHVSIISVLQNSRTDREISIESSPSCLIVVLRC